MREVISQMRKAIRLMREAINLMRAAIRLMSEALSLMREAIRLMREAISLMREAIREPSGGPSVVVIKEQSIAIHSNQEQSPHLESPLAVLNPHSLGCNQEQSIAIKSHHPTSRVPLRFSIPIAWAGCSEAASSASTREQPVNLWNRRMHSSKGKTAPASVSVPGRMARPSEVT